MIKKLVRQDRDNWTGESIVVTSQVASGRLVLT